MSLAENKEVTTPGFPYKKNFFFGYLDLLDQSS